MLKTRWIAITGAPCSGKSTVIHYLKKCGFKVITEVSQGYIDEQKKCGLSPWLTDLQSFQDEIFNRQSQAENDLIESNQSQQIVFIDRALPDAWAYYHYHNLETIPELELQHQYSQVLLFDKPQTDVHHEVDGEDPNRLVQELKKTYNDLGYSITNIPVMDVKARAMHVLQACGLSDHLSKLADNQPKEDLAIHHMYRKGYYLRSRKKPDVSKAEELNDEVKSTNYTHRNK